MVGPYSIKLKRMMYSVTAALAISATTAVLVAAAPARADVAFIVSLSVPDENAAAFDELANRMTAASAADEGMLIYEFARVGKTVYGYERYADEAAHDRHEAILAPFLPELSALAEFQDIVVLTPISDEKAEALRNIGALIGAPIAGIAQGTLEE